MLELEDADDGGFAENPKPEEAAGAAVDVDPLNDKPVPPPLLLPLLSLLLPFVVVARSAGLDEKPVPAAPVALLPLPASRTKEAPFVASIVLLSAVLLLLLRLAEVAAATASSMPEFTARLGFSGLSVRNEATCSSSFCWSASRSASSNW